MMNVATTRRALWQWGAAELAQGIARREISATEVLTAHLERIAAVNPRLNALVAPCTAEAQRAAEQADAALRDGAPVGPLHGVPFTVKECFHVAGLASTIGVARFRNEIETVDAPLVTRLRQAGGILLGKTNVAQMLLFYEADNPVYGPTRNPWHPDRSPGGSGGGEAALVAAGGSPLGLGTDIGGSIRCPAHTCGIYSFLPTPGCLATDGMRTNLPNFHAIQLQPGFMARHVADLRLGLAALNDGPTAEHEPDNLSALRIGYWTDDGCFTPSPAIRRAVRDAAQAFANLGATVVEFQPPRAAEALLLFYALLSADGGRGFREILQDSPRDPRVSRLLRLCGLPGWLRPFVAWMTRLMGRRKLAEAMTQVGWRSASEMQALLATKTEFQSQFQAAMRAANVQLLLSPPYALPALRHGTSAQLPNAASHCVLMNILGFPSGTAPITRVRPDEETDRMNATDPSDRAAIRVEKGSAGLPVGVQLAAPPGQDSTILTALQALESSFQSLPEFPQTPTMYTRTSVA